MTEYVDKFYQLLVYKLNNYIEEFLNVETFSKITNLRIWMIFRVKILNFFKFVKENDVKTFQARNFPYLAM